MRDGIPVDLLAVCIAAVVTPVFALLGLEGGFVQIVAGAAFILVAPGYALVSFLIPSRHLVTPGGPSTSGDLEVSFFERTLLAVGLSIALVPLVGVILHYSPLGLGPGPYLVVVGLGTLLLCAGAVIRRRQIEPNHRFGVGPVGFPGQVWSVLGGADTDREAHLNVLFILGLVLAVAGVGTAIAMSGGGEQFTEFYIEAEDPETGERIADEYPTNMSVGEGSSFTVGITNQEHQSSEYTVVVELQRLEGGEVVERSELQRFKRTLAHNETAEETIRVEPNRAGENLRLSFQLYRGTPPDDTTADTAYRHVYVWVDVTPS